MLPLCARRVSVVDKALVKEAKRRKKSLADLFRDLIAYGSPALPPLPEFYEALPAGEYFS